LRSERREGGGFEKKLEENKFVVQIATSSNTTDDAANGKRRNGSPRQGNGEINLKSNQSGRRGAANLPSKSSQGSGTRWPNESKIGLHALK